MSYEELLEAVRTVIAQELEFPPQELRNDRSLRNVYGLDSVAAVNIIFALETLLQIEISAADVASVDSVDDIGKLLVSRIGK
jgi:acyl carrier protein